MRRVILFITILFFAGCSSLRIQNDYNPQFDFKRLKSFAVVVPKNSSVITLTQERLKRAIKRTLEEKGYKSVPKESADFLVAFHTDVTKIKEIVNDYDSIGIYPYDYGFWGPPYIPTRYEYIYNEAQIVIDAIDPTTKKVFFRGTATDLLRDFKTPEERIAYINSVVRKILASFPSASK